MTRINRADLADVQVMKGHEQLRSQSAVVNIPGPEEKRPQELEHHVVQLHILPNHLGQF